MSLELGLYTPADRSTWAKDAVSVLSDGGYRTSRRAQSRIDAWQSDSARRLESGIAYVDGYTLDPCWVYPNSLTIRLHPKRFYFESNDLDRAIRRPEHQILNSQKRPETPASFLLGGAVDTGELLTSAGVVKQVAVDQESISTGLISATKGLGGHGRAFALDHDLWRNLSQAKAFSIPPHLKVMLIHDTGASQEKITMYAEMLEREWLPALGAEKRAGTVRVAALPTVLPAIKEIQAGLRKGEFEDAVFLVAIDGRPGERLPADQETFLKILDELGLPYRCFSADNPQPKWSARAQAVSILEGAGGIPYRLSLPNRDELEGTLLIGVDIGHDSRRRRVSHIVVSVLDQFGKHIVSCRKVEALNEAIAATVLRKLLVTARNAASARVGYKIKSALVFRDGLIPAQAQAPGRLAESVQIYRDALKLPLTIIELRKRGNPFLYRRSGSGYDVADPGIACAPNGSEIRFTTAYRAQAGLPRVFKTRIPEGLDELGIGVDAATAIAVGLCYSPSLGLRAHLPGPIYWADGLASTQAYSYKFAGQPVIDL